jgi:hypothetical protein
MAHCLLSLEGNVRRVKLPGVIDGFAYLRNPAVLSLQY